MIELSEFIAAHERIRQHVDTTPLRYSKWLSDKFDGEIYLKLENLNPGRSFKIRGATNTLLSQDELPEQVITASGGNHGLGVAIASNRLGLPCRVVLPKSTSPYRVELLQSLGSEVELYGEAWDEANSYALTKAKEPGSLYIHPFADMPVMIGQGTIACEIQNQLDNFDELGYLVASVGGGGLLAGNALALEAMGSDAKIVAVETRGADSLAQSLLAKKLVTLDDITSIAKTLGAKTTTQYIFDTMSRLVDHMLVVSDRAAVETMFRFLDEEKMLVEPATSCSIAAMMQHRDLFSGKVTAVIVCGSNVSYREALAWQKEFEVSL